MIQTNRFWKFAFLSAALVLFATGLILGYIWSELSIEQTRILLEIAQENIYAILALCFTLFGAFWAVSDIVYTLYIKPVKRMSAEAQVIYTSNPSHRLDLKGNKDITSLALVINDFADMFENLNKNITQQILTARKETEKERNLLAAIMSEIPHGIIICNKSGRILLFNSLARKIFTHKVYPGKTERFIGLGRSIFHLVDKSLVAHAIDEISAQLASGKDHVGSYFITPIYTKYLINVEAIPVLDHNRDMTGFILAFEEVSRDIEKYETIETKLYTYRQAMAYHTRRACDLFRENAGAPSSFERPSPLNAAKIELDLMEEKYVLLSDAVQNLALSRLPLTSLDLQRFLSMIQKEAGIRHNIRVNVYNPLKNRQIRADTYSLTRAIVFLMSALSPLGNLDEFQLTPTESNQDICLDLSWKGPALDVGDIQKIKKRKINALPHFDYVLKLNRTRFEIQGEGQTNGVRLFTKISLDHSARKKQRAPVVAGSRPEFYNFNLFKMDDQAKNLLDTQLNALTFTVFDTETTGLNPEGGDEIISIGGVRIVDNRINYQDIFEELIDPGRDIPIESYRIHGISHEMVRGRDRIEMVLPRFKRFASNTVFLGHNIAFDLKMLKVKEQSTGIKFTNPALDTLLLSAILHPVHEQHDMENIARRLGVNIIGRHTALGDALTTAEIFLKLIPILNSNGILTLNDALKASRKTYYARLKY